MSLYFEGNGNRPDFSRIYRSRWTQSAAFSVGSRGSKGQMWGPCQWFPIARRGGDEVTQW